MTQRYSTYKDSGIEWIGEIPEHWEVKRVKYISAVKVSSVDKHVFDDEIPVVLCNYTDVYKNEFINSEVLKSSGSCSQEELSKFSIKKGDVLITKDSEDPADMGVPAFVNDELEDTVCGYHLAILRTHEQDLKGAFLFRQLQTKYLRNYFEINSFGITRFGLGKSAIESLLSLIPPISEQTQIVEFLEAKTSLIDRLIAVKEKRIELLKEKRTALINHAVTKGLNPNVKMKDSGIEWIGEIPAHWAVKKLKYGVSNPALKAVPGDGEIKISPENVESDTGVCTNMYSDYEGEGFIFYKGDILFNKLRIYLKKILFAEYDGFSMGEMIVLRCNHGIHNRYLYFLLFNQGLIEFLNSQSTGIKMPRVSPEIILNTKIIYPSLSEQQQIVEYLDSETKRIDTLVSLEQRKIDLLKEYRQALISEAVTGKIKVTEDQ